MQQNGDSSEPQAVSQKMIENVFTNSDYESIYNEIRKSKLRAKDVLLNHDKSYPGELRGENIDDILKLARRKNQNDYEER